MLFKRRTWSIIIATTTWFHYAHNANSRTQWSWPPCWEAGGAQLSLWSSSSMDHCINHFNSTKLTVFLPFILKWFILFNIFISLFILRKPACLCVSSASCCVYVWRWIHLGRQGNNTIHRLSGTFQDTEFILGDKASAEYFSDTAWLLGIIILEMRIL